MACGFVFEARITHGAHPQRQQKQPATPLLQPDVTSAYERDAGEFLPPSHGIRQHSSLEFLLDRGAFRALEAGAQSSRRQRLEDLAPLGPCELHPRAVEAVRNARAPVNY